MLNLNELENGQALPERSYEPSNVSLFLYNAAIWNPHRIHYDERYTREVEKHPGVVIDGPLQGDWLTQAVIEWLDAQGVAGQLVEFEYSNRRASYLGETLTVGGTISAVSKGRVSFELFVKNEQGEVTTPGRATVQLDVTKSED